MSTHKSPLDPNAFRGPMTYQPPVVIDPTPPASEPEPTPHPLAEAPRDVAPRQPKRSQAKPKVGEEESPNGKPSKHYERLNLYVDKEIKRRVRRFVTEANAAELPLGQRGASVIMAAALDLYAEHTKAERLEAVERRL